MHVRFLSDFTWIKPGNRRVRVHFKASPETVTVKRSQGDAAIAAGAAVLAGAAALGVDAFQAAGETVPSVDAEAPSDGDGAAH